MFAAIEKVMAERVSNTGTYTVAEKVVDILAAATEPMTNREIRLVLARLGMPHGRGTITACMGDLCDLGVAEYMGKAVRTVRSTTALLPVYVLAKKTEDD